MTGNRLPFLSHCFPRSLWPLWDRRTTWAVLALLALIGGLYLWQAGEIAATQHHIRELEQEHEYWQRENAELRREIAELTSVTVLTKRAQALGFTMPQGEIYLPLRERDTPAPARLIPSDQDRQ